MLEKKVEKPSCKNAVDAGWLVWKFASPGRRARSDRFFLKGGRSLFVEFKGPGKRPTDLQYHNMLLIQDHGGEAYWCDNVDDCMALLGIGGVVCLSTKARLSNVPVEVKSRIGYVEY